MPVRQAARTLRPGYHLELGVAPLEEVQIVDAGPWLLREPAVADRGGRG